jgi:hypothetical protein
MDVSGRAHEGWMALIPAAVLLFIVVGVLGGPTAFANTVSVWAGDMLTAAVAWFKQL